jgi:uncharacterized membrane protein YkoI
VVERAKADDDDERRGAAAKDTRISPERAAQLAIQRNGGGRLSFSEKQDRNGRKRYQIRVNQVTYYVDADNGAVTKGDD